MRTVINRCRLSLHKLTDGELHQLIIITQQNITQAVEQRHALKCEEARRQQSNDRLF